MQVPRVLKTEDVGRHFRNEGAEFASPNSNCLIALGTTAEILSLIALNQLASASTERRIKLFALSMPLRSTSWRRTMQCQRFMRGGLMLMWTQELPCSIDILKLRNFSHFPAPQKARASFAEVLAFILRMKVGNTNI